MTTNPQPQAGPQLLADGGVLFTLWAPTQQPVLELLDDSGHEVRHSLPLQPCEGADDGWLCCQVSAAQARADSLYRYRFAGALAAPDPASRCNPLGVHGPSQVVDTAALQLSNIWRGRPWTDAVLYELHVGTFTPQGTLAAAAEQLPALQALGITAIELMPLAAFAGEHGWGYDGVLPSALHAPYGRPEDLRAFVDAAHGLGLMVMLDVVYNHFGPDGNYLAAWCPAFFDAQVQTPWGPGIRFDQPAVRSFFVQSALYWVETFGLDGLRLDAVHAIHDEHSPVHIVEEIAAALQAGPGRDRVVHMMLENDDNVAQLLRRDAQGKPLAASAQWNDDLHHAAHVLATGEQHGYYGDYADATDPAAPLARALAEGFVYQGQPSAFRKSAARGEPSTGLVSAAFVDFLQNHDQVGNRALGERLDALAPTARVEALLACLLLSPAVPMLFMGEEFAATSPFLYFCDFDASLGAAVANGRRAEFASFPAFADPAARERIPDPNAAATFAASRLRWRDRDSAAGQRRLALVRQLLGLRRRLLMPMLPLQQHGGHSNSQGGVLEVTWALGHNHWRLRANFGDERTTLAVQASEQQLYALHADMTAPQSVQLQPNGVFVTLQAA